MSEELAEVTPRYKDEDLLRRLYVDEIRSTEDIADMLDCAPNTVRKYLKRAGVELRSMSEAISAAYGNHRKVSFQTQENRGHETWWISQNGEGNSVYVHRLLAVAEYGIDAVAGMHVHHKNEIPWDNRPENIELLTLSQHSEKHKKVSGLDRLRIAELYENGDIGSRPLAEHVDHDISMTTVLEIHKEFYGGDAS